MNAIQSVVKNGRVEVDAPPDWPDGTPVRVELGLTGQAEYDDESPETPEEIEAWLRWYHSLEPIAMTPEEEAAWEADRKMQKEFDIANAAERDRRIEGIFE
ncbi:MAG: hypothetical protein ACXWOV_13230 [Isosphaeraceae bacterium]